MNRIENIFKKEEVKKMIEQDKTKYIILILWEILNMAAVVYIQYFLRPANTFYSATETFLLGTLPSLFGAAGFVTVLFIYYKIYLKRLGRYKLLNSIVFSFFVTFFWFFIVGSNTYGTIPV